MKKAKMPSSVDYRDVQGLVRFGFARMTEACYLLLRIKDAAAAREWLRNAPITTAEEKKPLPQTALQLAFTSEGLKKMQVPASVIEGFAAAFRLGMAGEENLSRRLGDIGANSPERWLWGSSGKVPHAVVMLFAGPGLLEGWKQSIQTKSWTAAFDEIACLPTTDMGGVEPFGFIDGISQPELDWEQARRVSINGDQLEYGNLVCLGEFLLGYSNEYGRFTDRPLLDPRDRGSEELLSAADQPEKKDLGLNGTFVVMRQLEQEVRGFWQFLDKASGADRDARYKLAEAFVGRAYSDGAPLVPLNKTPIAGVGSASSDAKRKQDIERNQFTYNSDVDGTRCPFGAHIRRGNPRNSDIPGDPKGLISHLIHILGFGNKNVRDDLIASTRFHRVLRRGREYGKKLSPDEALQPAPSDDGERGLHFVAVNANITRQFEFVQNAWMMRTKFDGLTEESDPLLGNREAVPGCPFTNSFSLPQENGVRRRIMDVPQFIVVRGGAYFFLPSMRALRYLCKIGS
ncbi:MAG TPA: peroxidase [Candidatus Angelobacter sp.]